MKDKERKRMELNNSIIYLSLFNLLCISFEFRLSFSVIFSSLSVNFLISYALNHLLKYVEHLFSCNFCFSDDANQTIFQCRMNFFVVCWFDMILLKRAGLQRFGYWEKP